MHNEKGEEMPTRLTTGLRVCIDYRRLNEVTRKDHFPLPFMDQLLERIFGQPFYCFLDGYTEGECEHCRNFCSVAKFSQFALFCCVDHFLTAFCGFVPNFPHCILCCFIVFCNFLDYE